MPLRGPRLARIVEALADDQPLEPRHHDYELSGERGDHRDGHVKPNLMLDEPRRAADGDLYEEQAYRLATTGEFVRPVQLEGGWRVHDGERYSTHPVGYVVYLAAIYLSYPAVGELFAECITDTGCRAGQPVRGIAAAAVVLVTALFSANVLLALATPHWRPRRGSGRRSGSASSAV